MTESTDQAQKHQVIEPNTQNLNQQQGNSEQFRSNQRQAAEPLSAIPEPRDGRQFIDPSGHREVAGREEAEDNDPTNDMPNVPVGGEVF